MNGRGFPAAPAAALCALLALLPAACAPQRVLLMPSPPTEMRKEPQASVAVPGAAEPPRASAPSTSTPPAAAPPPQTGTGKERHAPAAVSGAAESPRAPAPSTSAQLPGSPSPGSSSTTAPVPAAPPPGERRDVPAPPPDPVARYTEAVDRTTAALRKGNAREAVPFWRALEESRWGADAVFNQGVLLQLSGDLDGAAARYGRLVDGKTVFEPAAANLLGIHLLRGEMDRMTALLARLLPQGPLSQWNALPELQANAAAALVETGRPEEAAAVLESMAARGRRTQALPWTAAVISHRRGDREAARKLAAGLPPEIADLFPVFASRYALGGEADPARGLPAVPAGQPRLAELLSNLAGFSEYRKGNAAAGEKALSRRPDAGSPAPEISTNLGVLQAEQGKWKEARANLERAVRDNPALSEGWLNLGLFREIYEGDPSGARECYERYVKLKGSRSEEVNRWLDRPGK